jgi:multidrug efflux system membrane fusion protein
MQHVTSVPAARPSARFHILIAALFVVFVVLCGSSCSQSAGGSGGGPTGRSGGASAVAVMTAPATARPMPTIVRAVGHVEASSTVDVRAQVSGELLTVDFTEGQEVTAGQLLFTIDARPLEAALKQTEASAARDAAQAKNAEAQLARARDLLQRGLLSPSEHDAMAAQAAALRATTEANVAEIDLARLQLQYTRILAPVSGRTGAILTHRGTIVRPSDPQPLVIINGMAPVFVSFAVPARLLPELRRGRDLEVQASPTGATDSASSGVVSFIDNAVDSATDSVRLKATFSNGDRRLWPGAFVNVSLQLAMNPQAIVIPSAAVQSSQQGTFVYVVKADQTVEVRPVVVGWIEGRESVIQSGVRADETVVTDGQLRLTPGARVSVPNRASSSGS